MNISFVLIKPSACREKFLEVVRNHLDGHGIRVDDMQLLTGTQVNRGAYVERHYSALASLAECPSEDLAGFMSEGSASQFFSTFGELWDAVMEGRRVLTACDAMKALGVSRELLSVRWWASKLKAKLEPGMHIAYFEDENVYVINGFYPLLSETLTAPDNQLCFLIVSWPETRYSWQHFILEVIGAADPSEAAPTSLRGIMYANWEEYELNEQPSLMENGIECASGPLEALASRIIWMHRRVNEDDFGRLLLQEGIGGDFIEKLVKNPILSHEGVGRSVFEITKGMQSSEVLRYAAVLYNAKPKDAIPDSAIAEYLPSDSPDWTIVLSDEGGAEPRNRAVVFVKPHANTPETRAVVGERLMQVSGMQVVSEHHVCGSAIAARRIMEKHYGTIARYAVKVSPWSIRLSQHEEERFEVIFNIPWNEALQGNLVYNAQAAMHFLGELTSSELYDMWSSCGTVAKLGCGIYVGHFRSENIFVINGFFPYLRDTFEAQDACVTCYVVSWPEACLTWKQFREELIGATDPLKASSTSLRGLIRDRWLELGLKQAPTTTDNGVHASAGPLEAVFERHLWAGAPLTHDPFMLRLQKRGLTGALLYGWRSNPKVVMSNGEIGGSVFDLQENLQTSEMVELMCDAEQKALASCNASPTNRALVMLKPFAVNSWTILTVKNALNAANVVVKRDMSLFSTYVCDRFLSSDTFYKVGRFADLSPVSLNSEISRSTKKMFQSFFNLEWNACLLLGKLMGATTACEKFQLSPSALLKEWDNSERVELNPHCQAAYLASRDVYVLNGFIPFLRDIYGRAGSRVHVFEVEWAEDVWTWHDFCDVLVGDVGSGDPRKAAEGSLQRMLTEGWREFDLRVQPVSYATAPLYVSQGPLEAAADREIWFEAELSEDPFVQHLLLEGVPLSMLIPYIRDERNDDKKKAAYQSRRRSYEHMENDSDSQCWSVNSVYLLQYTRSELSHHQQSSEVVRRLKVITSRFLRDIKMNYAFIWVKPHACTANVEAWVPKALGIHRVEVISSGSVNMEEVFEKKLADRWYSTLYRNAMTRNVNEIPVTKKQMNEFNCVFGIAWSTALSLHLIINAAQAEERMGVLRLLNEWDQAKLKVSLSPSLYVAYIETEGLYVVNGFYPVVHSRLHTGKYISWYVVSWDSEVMTWPDFQRYVIGADVPAAAESNSLRNALYTSWEQLGLQRQPDGIDNGFHASFSPVEALADRVSWLDVCVEEDVFGRLLVTGGVDADYLQMMLTNPLVRHRDEPIELAGDAFDKLCTETPLLIAQLVGLQSSGGMQVVPHDVRSRAVLPLPIPTLLSVEAGEVGVSKFTPQQSPNAAAPQKEVEADEDRANFLNAKAAGFQRNYGFLMVNPSCTSSECEPIVLQYVEDFLQRHKINVDSKGCVTSINSEARRVAEAIQNGVFKYAIKQSPHQYDIDQTALQNFFDAFGEPWSPGNVRNAVDAAVEFNYSATQLKEKWDACKTIARIAPNLYVGKMPESDIYLVNGFALNSIDTFCNPSSVKYYYLVSWDRENGSYSRYLDDVVGDPYLQEAKPGSLQRALLEDWKALGLKCQPDRFEGAVMTSTSPLEAIQLRQMWFSSDLSRDGVARFALEQLGISPYVMRRILTNPRTDSGDGRYAFDTMRGTSSAEVLGFLLKEEKKHRDEQPRNCALILMKDHALCRAFSLTLETVLARYKIRVDEEGDVCGATLRRRGFVRHLYSTALRYAARDVTTIKLTREESDAVRRTFGTTWEEMLSSGLLVNANRAMELLGSPTPFKLFYKCSAASRKLMIRHDFWITELPFDGMFVVNGFMPGLKQFMESTNALLHWYVVSWPEDRMNWPTFLRCVVGHEAPKLALKESIRGQLYRRWKEYGLLEPPDELRNGVYVSGGALQAIRERTQCLDYSVREDYLGSVLLSRGVSEKVLQVWLDNPDVISDGVEASIFEHLGLCDTSRAISLLSSLTEELCTDTDDTAKAARLPDAAGSIINGRVLCPDAVSLVDGEKDGNDAQRKETRRAETGSALLYRNSAMIVLKPHASDKIKVMELLERTLAENAVYIKKERRKRAQPKLVDAHFSSCIFYANKSVDTFPEVTDEGKAEFLQAFDEEWEYALQSNRVLGAFEAIDRLNLTPSQLFIKWSLPQQHHVQLAHDMEVTKFHAEGIYVINATLPLERERLIQGESGENDVHCYVVTWDQRDCSWRKFLSDVIGHPDPARANEHSFRGQLFAKWEAYGLSAKPNRIDNVVLVSDGPLQAFKERELWCGAGDLAPDTLVRALCYLDHDPQDLNEWIENPLVSYTGPSGRGNNNNPVFTRMFGFTCGLDTRDFIDFLSERNGFFVPVEAQCTRNGEQFPPENYIPCHQNAPGSVARTLSGSPATRCSLRGIGGHRFVCDYGDDWVNTALVNGSDRDVPRLWAHYGGKVMPTVSEQKDGCDETEASHGSICAHGSIRVRLSGTVDGEVFRRDIEKLDCFGQPLAMCKMEKIFEGMTERGDNRITTDEFRVAVAILQQM
ncbi:hypothetical protein ERJ75_000990100 [Trypanosoma vivax]|nr:hypothetical protein ERJ75_000990100 [Trypanosoma vivax]